MLKLRLCLDQFYILFHLIGYTRITLPHLTEKWCSSPPSYYECGVVSLISNEIFRKSASQESNPQPPTPPGEVILALKHTDNFQLLAEKCFDKILVILWWHHCVYRSKVISSPYKYVGFGRDIQMSPTLTYDKVVNFRFLIFLP